MFCIFKWVLNVEKKLVCNFLDNLCLVFVFVWYIFIDNKMKSYIYVFLLYGEKKYKCNWK